MKSEHVFAFLAIALFLKMLATTGLQAVSRRRANAYARPEDAAHWGGTTDDAPSAKLAQLALRNDGENIPLFLAIAGAYAFTRGEPRALLGYASVFTIARYAHTFAYVKPRQPLRNRAYVTGLVTTLAMASHTGFLVLHAIATA